MTEKGIYSKYQQLEEKGIWFNLYQLWCYQIHFLNIFILKHFSELFSSANRSESQSLTSVLILSSY